ncbi:MAG TPA: hypothetical protein VJK54_08465, partial [Chthoniobacterales bacterium]|nr:hypothetical protein [Chthoniobacterales bacterium]
WGDALKKAIVQQQSWCDKEGKLTKKSAEILIKGIEVAKNEYDTKTIPIEYREAAEKLEKAVSEYYLKATQAYAAGKTLEGYSWYDVGVAIKAETLLKAIEAGENGKAAVVAQYEEAAKKMERSVSEYYLKAIQAFAIGKTEEGKILKTTAIIIYRSAEMLLKAIEADENDKIAVATQYREVAEKMERLISYLVVIKAHSAGKPDEKLVLQPHFGCAVHAIDKSVGTLLKAIEADENDKTAVATQYREVAEILGGAGSECYFKSAQAHAVGKTDEGGIWGEAGYAIVQRSAERLLEAIEADENGKTAVATQYREVAKKWERVGSEYYLKAAQAYAVGKEDESQSWKNTAIAIKASAETLEQAIRAEENGKTAMTTQYREVAEKWERAGSEYFLKVAQACATGKTDEGECWENAGIAIEKSAKILLKAIEADENGKATVATQFRETVEKMERSVSEYYLKAIQAYDAVKAQEAQNWMNAGHAIKKSAETFIKSIEADENGKTTVATQYREVTEKMQRALNEYYLKAVQAYDKDDDLFRAGNAIEKSAEILLKAIEADEEGKVVVATQYRKAAEKWERVGNEYYLKAAQAYAVGNKNESQSWKNVGRAIMTSAETLIKAIEADEKGKAAVAIQYREIAEKIERTVSELSEYYVKTVPHDEELKIVGHYKWGYLCIPIEKSIEAFIKAIEAVEVGENAKATVVTQYKKVAENYLKAAQTFAAVCQNDKQMKNLQNAGNAIQQSAETLLKAIEAEVAGKPEIDQKWREVAEQRERSVEFYIQAAQAYTLGKQDESICWQDADNAIKKSAEILLKAIEADENDKAALATQYREVAEKMGKVISEYYVKAIQAYAVEKTNEGICWEFAGNAIQQSAETLLKAIEAKENGKAAVAIKYREVVEKWERIGSVYYLKAIQAFAVEKRLEANIWKDICNAIEKSAEMLLKAIEADENGKTAVATQYREVAEKWERIGSEYHLKAIQAFAVGKDNAGECCSYACIIISKSAKTLLKAIEADENGKTAVATQYREVAEKLEKAVSECALKAIQAYTAGKTDVGDILNGFSIFMEKSAEILLKAIEADEKGKAAVAIQYREAAEKMERSVSEYFLKAIEAHSQGKVNEGKSWYNAGNAIQQSAETLLKAIEARQSNKVSLAEEYNAAAEKYNAAAEKHTEAAKARSTGNWFTGAGKFEAEGNTLNAEAEAIIKKAELKR